MKIFVIDDEEAIRESFKMILAIKGYEVVTVPDGETALNQLTPDFDVIFTGYNLGPGRMNGIELLKQIKATYSHIPIVIVTAYNSPSTRDEALKCGALDYILKPFLMENIYELVDRASQNKAQYLKGKDLFDIQIDRLTTLLAQCEMEELKGNDGGAIENCLEAIKIIPHPKIYLKLARLYKKNNPSLAIENVNLGIFFQESQGLGIREVFEELKAEVSPSERLYCADCWRELFVPSKSENLDFLCPKCGNEIQFRPKNKNPFDALAKMFGVYDYGFRTEGPLVEPVKRLELLTSEKNQRLTPKTEIRPYIPGRRKKRKKRIDFGEIDYEWLRIRNAAKEKDGYKCTMCGSRENLHVHHSVPRSEGGDDSLDNLVTLCEKCHRIQAAPGHRLIGKDVKFKTPFCIKVRPIARQSDILNKKISNLLKMSTKDHETLKMVYKKPLKDGSVQISRREVDVYLIRSGYIGCYCHIRSEPRTFKLSRIQGVYHTGKHFSVRQEILDEIEGMDFWQELSTS